MKRYVHAYIMCQSMFCALPCPTNVWDEDARPLMLLFLPLVGLEIGLLWAAAAWLCSYLGLQPNITGLILCALPYLTTGCIHLDGFLDVTDAVRSCRDLEKRRQILKDSHVGAFAVIGCVLLMLSGFALLSSARHTYWPILAFVPVVSRCGSALAVTLLRPLSESQYAGAFRPNIPKTQPVLLCLTLLAILFAAVLYAPKSTIVLLCGILGYALALRRGCKALGGMNGDISGYALTLSELAAIAAYALL